MTSFCQRARDLAVAWLEDELSASESEQISAHLEDCRECQAYYADLSSLELRPPKLAGSAGANDWSKMDRALDLEMDSWDRPRRSPFILVGWQGWLAAAAVLLSLAWGAHQYRQAEMLRITVEHQSRQLERMERAMQASPRSPQQPYVLPAVHVPNRMDL